MPSEKITPPDGISDSSTSSSPVLDDAGDDRGARVPAAERLADDEDQPRILPLELHARRRLGRRPAP